jgi:hypothetical protein
MRNPPHDQTANTQNDCLDNFDWRELAGSVPIGFAQQDMYFQAAG